jgi:outer membrane receptor protein involved in Fe transport
LFGGNSTGGAINYIAAKPTADFRAGADLGIQNFGEVQVQGFASGPLSSTLRARLFARMEKGGAWQKSFSRNDELGDSDRLFGRLLLDWAPTDRFTVELNLNAWRDKSDTQAAQFLTACKPGACFAPLVNYSPMPSNARMADWDAGQKFRRDDRFYQAAARAKYNISDDLDLDLLVSYDDMDVSSLTDADGTAVENAKAALSGTIRSFYEEARLSGVNGSLKWIIGQSYQNDRTREDQLSYSARASVPFVTSVPINDQDSKTWAAFASVDYAIADGFRLEGGLRYTKQDRDFSGCLKDTGDGSIAQFFSRAFRVNALPGQCGTIGAAGLPALVTNVLNEDNLSWRAGLNWQVDPASLFYANISKGYKNGSFPTLGAIRAFQLDPVTQESVVAYEAGFKLRLVGGMVQVNGAGFYYDYKNKQFRGKVPSIIGPQNALVNIPKSSIRGVELNLIWNLTPEIRFTGGATYIDSKIANGFSNYNAYGVADDFSGQAFPFTPKWDVNAGLDYRAPIANGISLLAGTNMIFKSPTNAGFGEVGDFKIDKYVLVDARLGIEGDDKKWKAEIYSKNIFNKYYWNNTFLVLDTTVRYAGMPRTYGLRLSFRY